MHSSRELHDEAVTLTWCTCELCSSVGPRFMTLVKNHHEYTVELNSHCCSLGEEDELVSGDKSRASARQYPRNQIRR
jgi:hypothetical protein